MKKIFTCLATAAIAACTFSAQAESIELLPTLQIGGEWVYCDGVDAEININRNGSYTINNFFGENQSVTFTADELISGVQYKIKIPEVGNISIDGISKRFFRDENDKPWVFNIKYGQTDYTLTKTYWYQGKNSYLEIYSDSDAQTKGYNYHAQIKCDTYLSTGTDFIPFYIDFYFGKIETSTTPDPEPEPSDAVEVGRTTVTANFQTYTNADGYVDFFAPFEMELVKYSDGSYAIPNFINSGNDFKFTFDQPTVDGYTGIKLLSNSENVGTDWEWGDDWSGWDALLNPDGSEYYEISGKNAAGTEVYIYDIAIDQEADYSYVCKYDMTDTSNKYEYYLQACFFGYDEAENFDYYYLKFFFNDPAAGAGVAEINAADNNAPVEYYNLNGVRVNNPSNGIFIRKQGSKVSKVIMK